MAVFDITLRYFLDIHQCLHSHMDFKIVSISELDNQCTILFNSNFNHPNTHTYTCIHMLLYINKIHGCISSLIF